MYIVRYPARPAIQGDEARQQTRARCAAACWAWLAGFYRDFIKDLCVASPSHSTTCSQSMLEFPRKKWQFEVHTHTDACTVAIAAVLLQRDPEGKTTHHNIEHFISKVLAKAQRKVSIPVLECCYAIHHHGAAPQVPSVQHLRDALQDLCGTSGEPDVRDRKKKILDRREQRMAMLNTAPNGRATYALSEATNMGAEMERLMQDGLPKTDQGGSTRNGYASSSKRKEERTAAAGPETDARQTEAERGTTERQLVQEDHPTGAEQVGKQKEG